MGKAGAINALRRPKGNGSQAPQALTTKRACYGQPFSGIRERAQKMAAVAHLGQTRISKLLAYLTKTAKVGSSAVFVIY